ncbi:RSP_7527 family protein [Bradyrhizobium sp. Lot33]
MKLTRRDPARRITPELLAFYIKRAHALRAEAYRDMTRASWDWLMKVIHKR